jgi:hypothetical protein
LVLYAPSGRLPIGKINCTAIRRCGVIKSDDNIIKNDDKIIKSDDRYFMTFSLELIIFKVWT